MATNDKNGTGRVLRILIAEAVPADADMMVEELQRAGYHVQWKRVATPAQMTEALDTHEWDVVLADYSIPDLSISESLNILRRKQNGFELPFVLVARSIDERQAVSILKRGIHDYVLKQNLARLVPVIERALRDGEAQRLRRRVEEALRRSEERYRELIENANDVVLSVDLQGNFTSLNTAGELISGYTRNELRRMNMADVLTPESYQRALEMIRQKLIEDRPTTYELEVIARDGHHVPLEVSTRLLFHDGKPSGVQGIARDITERKRAAEALGESEERYRGLFENASDIVYTHDLEGNFIAANRAATLVTEYDRDRLLELNIADIVVPEHLTRAREMIQRKLDESLTTAYEVDIRTKSGRRRTLEVNTQLIYQRGEPVGVQGIARDVTQRRQAEAEMRAREHKQAVVAEVGQRALASIDLGTLFTETVDAVAETLHARFCSILELLPDGTTLLGRAGSGWHEGIMGRTTVGAGPQSQAGYTLLSREPVVVSDLEREQRFTVPDVLRQHGLRSGVSVIIGGRNRPFGVLSVFTTEQRSFEQDDVHFLQAVANVLAAAIERRMLEEARAQHANELSTRVLQAQEEERKRIARELHDETAQSLSILLTNLDLLEPHIPANNAMLRSGFDRVGELARRTLDETRALSHDLRPTILDDAGLVAALEWVAAEYEQDFGGTVHVDTQFEPGLQLSPEMEVALFRIAQEALTNSGKHADATTVRVSLDVKEEAVQLIVEDDGSGFIPEDVPGPTREGRLGLYGMKERAALLGGAIHVSTSPGHGTEVRVDIPMPQTVKTGPDMDNASIPQVGGYGT